MRKDLPKKFLEPCGGKKSKFPRSSKRLRTTEDGDSLMPQSMSKPYSIANRESSRYTGTDFALMRRFLRSRVGQPWNDVFSEICEHADYRSHSGHHLREWLSYEVEQNCFIAEDGSLCDEHGHDIKFWWHHFYVHPETGRLEFNQSKLHLKSTARQTVFKVDGQLYYRHKDIWYRVRFKKLPKARNSWGDRVYTREFQDIFGVGVFSFYRWADELLRAYGLDDDGDIRYCDWRESANKREIKKIKKQLGEK
jgi:hypothetical protein